MVMMYCSKKIQIEISKGKMHVNRHLRGIRHTNFQLLSPSGVAWTSLSSPIQDVTTHEKCYQPGKLTQVLGSRVFTEDTSHRYVTPARPILATKSTAAQRSQWYSVAQGLRNKKHSYQAGYSKVSKVISQDPVKGQSPKDRTFFGIFRAQASWVC